MRHKLTIVLILLGLSTHAQIANAYDVVIDEIMADPSPVVGLPNSEFIELRNTSSQSFNLNGWRIGDASGFATINTNFILKPDSFVVVCANSAVASFTVFGSCIGVSSFPSLDNDGDQLYIRSKEGKIIHAVSYTIDWYRNPVKSQGGYTLEMIDSRNPCTGFNNWTASNDAKGGTPGKKNAVDGINKDNQPPMLLSAYTTDSVTAVLVFDEPLDSMKATLIANYTVSNITTQPSSAIAIGPLFDKVQLRFRDPFPVNKIYTVTVNNVTDCAGNAVGAYDTARFGHSSVAGNNDLVINEILFNPKPDGVDYVELYNRSNLIIDLKDCYIANRSSTGVIGSLKQICVDSRLLFPGDYMVVTSDPLAVKAQYLAKDPNAFVSISTMPSMPDDKGDVLILNAQGGIVDELAYDAHWQFALLNNPEGVALERIDYNKTTQNAANWHSAATSAGYGTPGYQNSQFKIDAQPAGDLRATPLVFSPDNDGLDDFLTINYQFPEPGYTSNITIYDANGRPVRYLTRNALCGLQGYFRWDGLDEKNSKLAIGVYVIVSEVFNLQGKTKQYKQAVTLARRLN